MAILVCAASAREMAAIAPSLFPRDDAVPEMQPLRVKLKHEDAIFLVTGVGPLNAALSIGYALGLTHERTGADPVKAILCAGLAGAFDLELTPLCSLWQVTEEIWPEYGLNDGTCVTARAFSFPLWKKENEEIYDRIGLAEVSAIAFEGNFKGTPWPMCASLTVAGVSASFGRRETLWNKYRAWLENMEGFAAAYAAARAEIPCVEIRAVSNKVGPRSREEKDFSGALKALGKILPALNLI